MQADIELLHAALLGYSVQLKTIAERMTEIQQQLGTTSPSAVRTNNTVKPNGKRPVKPVTARKMSAEGRERIAAAQRKRWASKRKADKSAGQATASKKKVKVPIKRPRTVKVAKVVEAA